MNTPSVSPEHERIGDTLLTLNPVPGARNSYIITISDLATPDPATTRYEATLKGIGVTQMITDYFESICAMIRNGTPMEDIYREINDFMQELARGRGESDATQEPTGPGGTDWDAKNREKIKRMAKKQLDQVLAFYGQETVNGFEIVVSLQSTLGGDQYEIYFPQKVDSINIGGEDKSDLAEAVFNYAKREAMKVSTIDALHERVREFIRDSYRDN